MFSYLFSNYNNENLHCNIWELAKYQCVTFSPNNKKFPFNWFIVMLEIPLIFLTYLGHGGLFSWLMIVLKLPNFLY